MGEAPEVFLPLTGAIKVAGGGVRTINRGDPIPSDLAKGERDRLERLGAIGPEPGPVQTPPTPDEAQALADDMAKQIPEALHKGSIGVAVAPAPAEGEAAEAAPAAPAAPNLNSSNEEFDAFTAAANVDQVVAAADSPELAQALLESEEVVRKDSGGPRKGVVEGLVEKGAKPAD